jgi:hypothetical protein
MPSDKFQIAAERAAASYPAGVWFTLRPSERAAAIYSELRKLAAESVSRAEDAPVQPKDGRGAFARDPHSGKES